MSKFSDLLEFRERKNVAHSDALKAIQRDFESECRAAYKAKYPKRKFTMAKSAKDSQPEHGEIFKKWNEKAKTLVSAHSEDVAKIGGMLEDAAKEIEIPSFEGMTIYRTVDSSSYRSQGFGEHRYARADAEDHADKARAYGLTTHIREVLICEGKDCCGWPYRVIEYEVWVSTSPLGVEILGYKPEKETMADWVKKCDKRGVCPRVFFPFMNYEEEEKLRKAVHGE